MVYAQECSLPSGMYANLQEFLCSSAHTFVAAAMQSSKDPDSLSGVLSLSNLGMHEQRPNDWILYLLMILQLSLISLGFIFYPASRMVPIRECSSTLSVL